MVWYHFPPRGTNLVERKGTKMLIKFEADQLLVDRLKMHSGERVASKAFLFAALDAPDLAAEIRDLRTLIESQKTEIRRLCNIIEQARASAAQLLEKTGQGDLIDG